MVKHRVYNLQHIRPLAVRPLTDPESVTNPWGIFMADHSSEVAA